MNIKEYFQKHWQIIVIILLVMFGMSKCVKSCSRGQQIKTLNKEIVQKDSTITLYEDSIKYLNITKGNLSEQLSSEKSHNTNLTGVATTNIKSQTVKLDSLTNENKTIKTENKKLKKQVEQLQKQVEELTQQLPSE